MLNMISMYALFYQLLLLLSPCNKNNALNSSKIACFRIRERFHFTRVAHFSTHISMQFKRKILQSARDLRREDKFETIS